MAIDTAVPAEGTQSTPSTKTKPSIRDLFIFSFPNLPHSFVVLPLNIVIPQFYAAHTKVTLLQIAAMTTSSRILDAVLDPTIGFLCDRTPERFGRRKPWVFAAALVCSIAIFFLFQPNSQTQFLYYGVWSFLLYFGFSLFEIPRAAWTAELSRDYVQRSRINTYVAVLTVVGSLIFWLMPIALSRFTGTMAISGTALTGIAWLYVALMPASVLLAILFVPSGDAPTHRLATLRELFVSLRTNRPLWYYCGIIGAWGLSQGAFLSVSLIFISDYMHMASAYPLMMIVFFVAQAVAMPPWYRAVAKFGKHRVWAFSMFVDVITRPLVLLVPLLGGLPILLVLTALSAILNAPAYICPYAVLGDVVDYDLMRTRVNKAGNIFAFNTLLIKVTMAIGAGLSFTALDLVHYHVGGHNSSTALTGLLLCYLVYPALLYLLAVVFAWRFPITANRHRAILRRIARGAPFGPDPSQHT